MATDPAKQLARAQEVRELAARTLIMDHDGQRHTVSFMVPSNDQRSLRPPYRVTWRPEKKGEPEDNGWHCQCDHYKYNNEKHVNFKCKHIDAVRCLLTAIVES